MESDQATPNTCHRFGWNFPGGKFLKIQALLIRHEDGVDHSVRRGAAPNSPQRAAYPRRTTTQGTRGVTKSTPNTWDLPDAIGKSPLSYYNNPHAAGYDRPRSHHHHDRIDTHTHADKPPHHHNYQPRAHPNPDTPRDTCDETSRVQPHQHSSRRTTITTTHPCNTADTVNTDTGGGWHYVFKSYRPTQQQGRHARGLQFERPTIK